MDTRRVLFSTIFSSVLAFALAGMPVAASAGSWQPLIHQPPAPEIVDPATGADYGPGGAAAPLLMTDGSILIHNIGYRGSDGRIFKLTPDENGSYVNGTWSELATMPYQEYAATQAVLPDGRVIVEGGEYSYYGLYFTLTNQGAIYDPVTNTWTDVAPPPFFTDLYPPRAVWAPHPIGDSTSVVLADGTFMISDKMSYQAAKLDLATMTWTETGTATKSDINDEEGWVLLPSGKVLTTDCYVDYFFGLKSGYPADPTNSEIYDPATGAWSSAGSTVNTLTDPVLAETGPAVLRPDGTVFAVGSEGYTSIYDVASASWTAGPRLPLSPQGYQYTVQDGPGTLLPDGNVLFDASGGAAPYGYSSPPVAFFEFDGKRLIPEPTIPNAANDAAYSLNLLLLPTGQVMATDLSGDVEIYTPTPSNRENRWRPEIESVSRVLHPGGSYTLTGVRLNGMSQASMFGDEDQAATNYPLLRITNLKTHHVFYSRTHDFSSMAVASEDSVTMQFDVPAGEEKGPSKLEVVANGVASSPVIVQVR